MFKIVTLVLLFSGGLFALDPSTPVEVSVVKKEEALQEPGACFFIPPKGWEMIDPKVLLPEVKVMVKGKPKSDAHIPPSLNLALENTDLSLREYLDAVREMNTSDESRNWAEVGTIRTKAGEMVLTQLDLTTNWGEVRLFQAIMVKKGVAYVITATAQRDEFSLFSDDFNSSIASFTINKDIFQMVCDRAKRKELKTLVSQAKKEWKKDFQLYREAHPELGKDVLAKLAFESSTFQNDVWHPLQEKVATSYKTMGSKWQDKFFDTLKDDLLSLQ